MVPDVIVLTECWLPTCPQLPSIEGYECFASDNCRFQNDGVLIFGKRHFKLRVSKAGIRECNALVLTIDNCLSILGIYRSPSYQNLTIFTDSLSNFLSQCGRNTNMIITGDLNINIIPNSCGSGADGYLDVCSEHGFYAGNTLPTRGDNCLDHAMIRSKLKTAVTVCHEDITDHALVLVTLDYSPKKEKAKASYKIDLNAVNVEIEKTDWSRLYTMSDVNEACDFFCTSLTDLINKFKKPTCTPNSKTSLKQWITPGLLKCIRKRSKLHLQASKYPHDLHERRAHGSRLVRKNKVCDVCGKTYEKRRTLLDHMNTHTGQRPYKCACGIGFSYESALRSHERNKHGAHAPPPPPI
ncbi:hypothetical protein MSG28_015877 [Choristoneura fumiferana]|uniref:Uncharacterized protein n=1 Tax=Choristoneura fumiferana TaxID=7141 RepID=A0ACC0K4R1_CHOFU|nr:hypothetical protein MSG28_015877 [Choristoneura fumiferana]